MASVVLERLIAKCPLLYQYILDARMVFASSQLSRWLMRERVAAPTAADIVDLALHNVLTPPIDYIKGGVLAAGSPY